MRKTLLTIVFLSICTLAFSQENLFIVEDPITGLKGCMNLSREIVVPYDYEELEYLGEGYFITVKNSKVGMIDSQGKVCIPNLYGYGVLADINNKVLYASKNWEYGLIDFNNNILIPFQYDDIYAERKEDVLIVKKNGKYGFEKIGD